MASYRFCRTDDIGLLVAALNRCWSPYFPDDPAVTPEAFKRSIRDLQVWCSSCMVAFAGADPIAVLIGAKRSAGTLVHRIAVHPDHARQGHGRHLLASLSSKLAILGPPRIVAEVPDTLDAANELFQAAGYVRETVLTDYVLDRQVTNGHAIPGRVVIPVSIDDLAANGFFEETQPVLCWERSAETLTAKKDGLAGLAVASDERIEAYLIYKVDGEIVLIRSCVDDGGIRLERLLSQLGTAGLNTLRLSKVHADEIPRELLESIGFRRGARHSRWTATARPA